jgi:hypothetical protein
MKEPRWLLLLYALPTRRNAERVNLWRKLKKFGAVQLKTSGYLLPDEPTHLERFQWLSEQIRDAGGEATLIGLKEIHGVSNQDVVGLFNDARAADYKALAADCHQALSRARKGKPARRADELAKLRQRLGEIQEIDYFNSPAAHAAQMFLQRLERAATPRVTQPHTEPLAAARFVGETWLTRPRPGIDRAGSAWLIRKFIDPNAQFIFDGDPALHARAIPFDVADVEFSHQGEDCTFETLVRRFGIKDPVVAQMAQMVHDADLEDGKFQRWECLGINSVLSGWAKSEISDDELLAKGIECFEGLYRSLKH